MEILTVIAEQQMERLVRDIHHPALVRVVGVEEFDVTLVVGFVIGADGQGLAVG